MTKLINSKSMKSNTEKLLTVLRVLAWVVFIGLMIKAGAVLWSYFVSIGHPEAAKNLYMGMDLSDYRQYSLGQYSFVVGYKILLIITQAYIAYLMTRLLSQLNISRPFHAEVARLMQQISYFILGVWVVAMIHNIHLEVLERNAGLVGTHLPGEFIFMAGIVYVFAQLFKRGVDIQSENELTI